LTVFLNDLDRVSGLPGPRPNLPLLRALGLAVHGHGEAGKVFAHDLRQSKVLAQVYIGIFALACGAANPKDKKLIIQLIDSTDESEKERRDAVTHALEDVLAVRADEAVERLLPHADGYLHLHVLLTATTTPRVLTALKSAAPLLACIEAAFQMVIEAPRSAERSQGYRTLAESLPRQIATGAKRFVELSDWVAAKAETTDNPQARAILDAAINDLRPLLGEADTDRLRHSLEGSAKPARDPSRIVQGTRKRSRGR
jgi:hypothetical protein